LRSLAEKSHPRGKGGRTFCARIRSEVRIERVRGRKKRTILRIFRIRCAGGKGGSNNVFGEKKKQYGRYLPPPEKEKKSNFPNAHTCPTTKTSHLCSRGGRFPRKKSRVGSLACPPSVSGFLGAKFGFGVSRDALPGLLRSAKRQSPEGEKSRRVIRPPTQP